jgi:hypothetical protein
VRELYSSLCESSRGSSTRCGTAVWHPLPSSPSQTIFGFSECFPRIRREPLIFRRGMRVWRFQWTATHPGGSYPQPEVPMAGVLDDATLVVKVDRGHANALAVTFCRVTDKPPIYLGSSSTPLGSNCTCSGSSPSVPTRLSRTAGFPVWDEVEPVVRRIQWLMCLKNNSRKFRLNVSSAPLASFTM